MKKKKIKKINQDFLYFNFMYCNEQFVRRRIFNFIRNNAFIRSYLKPWMKTLQILICFWYFGQFTTLLRWGFCDLRNSCKIRPFLLTAALENILINKPWIIKLNWEAITKNDVCVLHKFPESRCSTSKNMENSTSETKIINRVKYYWQ